jgi:PTH1 family peptidyl-tRNA hydrolase
VGDVSRYFRFDLEDVLVVTDDVNLPLGRLRMRPRGSAGGHNGLDSIIQALGTIEVSRLRVGIGRGDARRDLADHVLARFEPDEASTIEQAIDRAADAVEWWATRGVESAMSRFNQEEPATPPQVDGC